MTQVKEIGWRRLPYTKMLHHFRTRDKSGIAVSACWMVAPRQSLKVDDDQPRCGLCEIMVAYHTGQDWFTKEA